MAKHGTMKRKTDKDVILEYFERYQPTEPDKQEAFGVSRQRMWEYERGMGRPGIARLAQMAKRGDWVGDMAREMLSLHGLTVSAPVISMPERETA